MKITPMAFGGQRAALAAAALLLAAACSQAPGGLQGGPAGGAPSPSSPFPVISPSAAAEPPPPPSPQPAASPTPAFSADSVPEEPGAVGEMLAGVESRIRDGATPEAEYVDLGRRHQAIYRALVARPAARAPALERLPPGLRADANAHITAGEELRRLTKPRESLPDWKVVPPPPAGELLAHYRAAEDRFGVGWNYLAAIHLVESRMGRIRGTSSAGAQGPMQFLPATWARYGGGDINSPRDSILAAGRYLAANGAPRDYDAALFRYNRSDRYVKAIKIYAAQMAANERLYLSYYNWQVYYRTTAGDVLLEEGYGF